MLSVYILHYILPQVLESCVLWCPSEMLEFTSDIVDISLRYITYDPNYNYISDEEDEDDYMLELYFSNTAPHPYS